VFAAFGLSPMRSRWARAHIGRIRRPISRNRAGTPLSWHRAILILRIAVRPALRWSTLIRRFTERRRTILGLAIRLLTIYLLAVKQVERQRLSVRLFALLLYISRFEQPLTVVRNTRLLQRWWRLAMACPPLKRLPLLIPRVPGISRFPGLARVPRVPLSSRLPLRSLVSRVRPRARSRAPLVRISAGLLVIDRWIRTVRPPWRTVIVPVVGWFVVVLTPSYFHARRLGSQFSSCPYGSCSAKLILVGRFLSTESLALGHSAQDHRQ